MTDRGVNQILVKKYKHQFVCVLLSIFDCVVFAKIASQKRIVLAASQRKEETTIWKNKIKCQLSKKVPPPNMRDVT